MRLLEPRATALRMPKKAGKGRRAVSIDTRDLPPGSLQSPVLRAFSSSARPRTRTGDTTTVSCTRATSSCACPPVTRESNSHAGFWRLKWRDPDSNRGHHDFQSWTGTSLTRAESLQFSMFSRAIRAGPMFANCFGFSPIWALRGVSVPNGASVARSVAVPVVIGAGRSVRPIHGSDETIVSGG